MSEADPLGAIRAPLARTTASWAGMSLAEIRTSFEVFLEEVGRFDGARPLREDLVLAGLPACRFTPDHAGGKAGILYMHGGGYQIGSMRSHASLMSRLAVACGLPVIGFDYRLAPEHRFPAAIEDAAAVYEALVAAGETPLAVAGDSAGGALALGTVMHARDAGLPLPGAVALLSPWLDLTMSGESYAALAEEDIFSKPPQLRAMARTYLGREGDPADRRASPVFGDLAGLPPILVHAGGADITLDDSRLLMRNAEAQGVRASLRIFPGMVHHFQAFTALPDAAESLREIGAFIGAALRD
jgi:monoterpene epsilon-lactone hydrolase